MKRIRVKYCPKWGEFIGVAIANARKLRQKTNAYSVWFWFNSRKPFILHEKAYKDRFYALWDERPISYKHLLKKGNKK